MLLRLRMLLCVISSLKSLTLTFCVITHFQTIDSILTYYNVRKHLMHSDEENEKYEKQRYNPKNVDVDVHTVMCVFGSV